jgi:Fur family peroxide stress response transcriptional regulator
MTKAARRDILEAERVFARHGLKKTPQRWAIWMELQDNASHPSADAIYRRVREGFPHISYDTVNRTLVHFAELGMVHVVEGTSEVKRFDPRTGEHHHLRCLRCGSIVDFQHKAYDALAVPQLPGRFKIMRRKVVLEGICEACQRR